MVETLMAARANPSHRDNVMQLMPLEIAAAKGRLGAVDVLLRWRALEGENGPARKHSLGDSLWLASSDGHADVVRRLVNAGAEATPEVLVAAVAGGHHRALAEALPAAGSPPERPEEVAGHRGDSPLTLAARLGQLRCVEVRPFQLLPLVGPSIRIFPIRLMWEHILCLGG